LKATWQKQVDSTLAFSRDLFECQRDFSGFRHVIMKQLAMSRPVFDKLCKIGKTEHLHRPEIASHLPPHYSMIYDLIKLDVPQLESHIASSKVHPGISRKDLRALVPPKNTPASSKKSPSSRLEIKVDWSLPEYQKSEFQKWLRDGQDRFPGLKVNWEDQPTAISAEVSSPSLAVREPTIEEIVEDAMRYVESLKAS
jgi:hypothetical protein